MNVLITGSSGQIGTNLGLAMMARGDRVIGVDCRPNTWTDRIETVQADLVKCGVEGLPKPDGHWSSLTDVCHWQLAASADTGGQAARGTQTLPVPPDGLNLVIHLAANAKVFELVENPQRAMDNITSLFTVLNYCRIHRLPIIFASSREVYGDIHRHITHETSADFVVAESPYSASKIAGEALIYSFAQCYDLPFLVFRFSNVYGRYDCDIERMERVIPLFIDRIAREQPIVVFGREKVLDFTYVDDAVAGVLLGADALVSGRVMRETINLACGQGNSLVDVVNIIALALGKKPQVRYEPSRVGEVTRYVADITKARTLLSYEPRTPLSEGLVKAVEWTKSFRKL